MPDQIVNIIILLAGVHGLYLAILILRKYHRLYANRFLALLMLGCSVILLNLYWSETSHSHRFSLLNLFIIGLTFVLNPMQYLYTRHLLAQTTRLRGRDVRHLIPLLLYWLTLLPLIFAAPESVEQLINQHIFHGVSWRFIIFNIAVALSGIVYMLFILHRLQVYCNGLTRVVSSLDEMRLQWLHNITILSLISWLIFSAENAAFLLLDLENYGFGISSAFSGIFIYLLGYWGLLKSDWLLQPRIVHNIEQVALELQLEREQTTTAPRYEKSGLSEERGNHYLEMLKELMQKERPWLNSDLTLTQLAELVSISPHNLSEVLNTRLQQTFFDFVNQYRIEQVKKDLMDPKKQQVKILALAFDAGFNSKTAFNTIFKKHTGRTPSEFREQYITVL